ncbi:PPIase cyclophilin-type domain-containing protein [Pseudoscourfieldia marina]
MSFKPSRIKPGTQTGNLAMALSLATFAMLGALTPLLLYRNPQFRTVDSDVTLPSNVARRGAFLNSGSRDAGPSNVPREFPKN